MNLLWVSLCLLIWSCGGDSYESQRYETPSTQAETDQNAIIDYLVEKSVKGAKRTDSGIYYTVKNAGDGETPKTEDIVKVHYKGQLLDGSVFDSSYERDEPAVFPLNRVVKGWQEGIPLFKEKGGGTLYIPSGLGYGARGAGADIPPNSVLVFDVELLDIMDEEELKAYQEEMMAKQAKMAEEQKAKDDGIIKKYLADNNLDAERTDEGVYYIIEKPGGSTKPTLESKVTVHYNGTLLENGKKFDSSYDRGQPATFPLSGVVPGWQIGIPKFGKGGKGKLLIPSGLAYGPQGSPGGIPPNSCLIFDIELQGIE